MARTQINPDAVDTLLSTEFSDTESTGSGMETSPTNLIDNINNILTMLREFSGSSDWFLTPSNNSDAFQTTSANSRQTFLFRTTVLTDVTVTAGQNFQILSVAGGEAPTQDAAVGAVSTEGAVVAFHTGTFGTHSLDEVSGPDALSPKNLCLIVDSTTGDAITSSNGFEIKALLQSESNVDGSTFDDTNNQVQLSFVERNAGGTDLVATAVADIAGETVNYAYVRRLQYQNIPESAFLNGGLSDNVAAVDVTLSNAAEFQSGDVSYTTKDINWEIPASGDHFRFEDGSNNNIATFELDGSGNGDVTLGSSGANSDVLVNGTNFDVDITNTATIQAGLSVDAAAAGTTVNIGVTPNQIDVAGNLTVDATAGSLTLNATAADATLQTTTSGAINIDSAGALDVDANGAITVNLDARVAGSGADGWDSTWTGGAGGTGTAGVTPTAAGAGGDASFVSGTGGAGQGTDTGGETGSDAGAGGLMTVQGGLGGAADAGTTDPGQPGAGGGLRLFGGAGGAGAGTSDNADGGDVTLTPGAPGTGGSGADGTRGVVNVTHGGPSTDPLLQLAATGTNGETTQFFSGSQDPSAGAGVAAPEGSLFMRDSGTAGELWLKTGATDTAWDEVTAGATSWDTVLATGNTSGGTDPVLTDGDTLRGEDSTSAAGGAAAIRGGDVTGGPSGNLPGGDVTIRGGGTDSTTNGSSGGAVTVTGGAYTGSGSGTGGDVSITGGSGTVANTDGGDVSITGGEAFDVPGNVAITGGEYSGASMGTGGNVTIDAGAATSGSNSVGGAVFIRSALGNTSGGGDTGDINIIVPDPPTGDNALGGSVLIDAGNTGSENNPGGDVEITAGDSNGSTGAARGGNVELTAGDNTNASGGSGGQIILTTGDHTDTGEEAGFVRMTGPNDEDEPLVQLETTGTNGELVELFAGSSDPSGSVDAPAGSLFFRDNGAGANIYLNNSTGSGTSWTELSSGDTTETLQEAYEAGNTIVTDSTNGDFDVSGTEAISLDASATSNFTVAGAALTLDTTTSGNVNVDAADAVTVTSNNGDVTITSDSAGSITAGTTVDLISGSTSDINLTAGASLDVSADCIDLSAVQTSNDTGTITYESFKHLFGVGNDGDTHTTLNFPFTTSSTTTGGMVVVRTGSTVDTTSIDTGGAESSTTNGGVNPLVNVTDASNFSAGDFVSLTGMADPCNEGIFEVDATDTGSTPNTITLRGVGSGTDTAQTFTARELVTDTTVQGTVTHVTVCVMQCNTSGTWQVADGDNADTLSFSALGTATGTSLDTAYQNGNTITVTDTDGSVIMNNTSTTNTSTDMLQVDLSPTVASTGGGVDITTNSNVSGVALTVTNGGSGNALQVIDGAADVLVVDGSGAVDITPSSGQDATITAAGAGVVDVNSGNAVTIDAAAASNFTVAGANLTLSTTTSGNVVASSAATVDVDGVDVEIDGSSSVALEAGATGTIDIGVDAVGKTVNIATATAGGGGTTVNMGNAAADTAVNIDSGSGDVAIESASGDITFTTSSGNQTSGTSDWIVNFPTKFTTSTSNVDRDAATAPGAIRNEATFASFENSTEGNLAVNFNTGYTTASGTNTFQATVVSGSATTDTITAFTNNGAATNPTATTAASGIFTAGDIVLVTGGSEEENLGLYEVVSHVGTTLTLAASPTAGAEFVKQQVATTTGDSATVTQVTVSVLRVNTSGDYQISEGFSNVSGISYQDLVAATDTLSSVVSNVGTSPAVQSDNFTWEVTDGDNLTWESETGNHTLISLAPAAAGDQVTIGDTGDAASDLNVNTASNTFDAGAVFDNAAAGTAIRVGLDATGGAANEIAATGGALTLSADGGALAVEVDDAGSNFTVATAANGSGSAGGVATALGNSTGGDGDGGGHAWASGDGNGTGTGGGWDVTCGVGGATGDGGAITWAGGTGGATSGTGGSIQGTAGSGGTGGGAGGLVSFTSGAGTSGNSAGALTLSIGASNAAAGPDMTFNGGDGAGSSNAAGDIIFNLGAPSAAGTAAAGKLTVNMEAAQGTTDASFVELVTEAGMSDEDHFIQLDGSNSTNGGNFQMFGGTQDPDTNVTGLPGSTYMRQAAAIDGALFVNTTTGTGAGTSWARVVTTDDNPSTFSKTVAATNTAISADTDVGGPSSAGNLDADLGDYSGVTFTTDVNVYVNGLLQRNGANSSANFDVYPGTSPSDGELRFEYGLQSGDVITMCIYSAL